MYAYPAAKNDFVFNSALDHKLFSLIKENASRKPVLIFCNTRKACLAAATQIAKDFKAASSRAWNVKASNICAQLSDKKLKDLAASGIAFHHAGLATPDRKLVEKAFLQGELMVIATTSTLSTGVNLPAHVVIIKGTNQWDFNSGSIPYTDLDIIQMLGRAGRPQFDKNGVSIILTELENKSKYERLVHSQTVLESSLHKNLAGHINVSSRAQRIHFGLLV